MPALQESCAVAPAAPNCAHLKRLSTLAAQFALKGYTLESHQRDGHPLYVVGRWGMNRTFTHLNDVHAFFGQVGGAS